MGLLYYVSYAAIFIVFAFVILSLASGLLYVSELIEEHSHFAKAVGQRGIYVIISLHVIFYVTDSLPLPQTLFSIFCHVVYLQNFSSTWPLISLTSLSFIASCLLVIADHFVWFFYFAHLTQDARHNRYKGRLTPQPPTFSEIASFFGICIWLAPLFLFLSLSANDNALPTSMSASGAEPATNAQEPHQRVSLFRSILSLAPAALRPKYREGLIAPPPQSPSLVPGQIPGPYLRHGMPSPSLGPGIPPPPRSPRLESSSGSTFRLANPPRRSGSGSGLRHVSSSSSVMAEDGFSKKDS